MTFWTSLLYLMFLATPRELERTHRYHVQLVEVTWHSGVGRYEADVRDYYADTLELHAQRPEGRAYPEGTALFVRIRLETVWWCMYGECRYADSFAVEHDGPVLLLAYDRNYRRMLWPQKPPDP